MEPGGAARGVAFGLPQAPVAPGCKWCIAIARLIAAKSARLPTLIAPSVMPRPLSKKGSIPAPDYDRLAPIRLTCPPTAKAFSDIAIALGPPISTTQSTPPPSRLCVPIGRLGVVDHFGGRQRLQPLGFLGGRGRRNHSSTRDPGELQRKDRDITRALAQDRVSCGNPAVTRQRDPGGHRGAIGTRYRQRCQSRRCDRLRSCPSSNVLRGKARERKDPIMHAMQIIEWGKPLEAREYPDPEPKGEEVLLRVEAAGVCHSDVHIWDGYFDMGGERRISLESRGVHLPFTMGHEIAGEVAALGSGVQVGDKVVAYPWIGCGECAVCRKGEELLCLNPRTLGTRRAGGYGTHVIVPHGRYLLPYEGVPRGLAATYTCSGITAFSALKKTRGHLGADDHLVIIGAGGVGGSAVHIAPAAVAGKVIVADIDAQKRAQARQMGAVATIDIHAGR